MTYLILGVALAVGLSLFLRWFVVADPKELSAVLKWILATLLLGLIVFLALTGRLGWAFAMLPVLFLWINRVRSALGFYRMFKGASGSSGGGARSNPGDMTREEAYEILGLQPGASTEEIKAAYHQLIGKLHPDHGGSTFLAAKINQAKDVLLGPKS